MNEMEELYVAIKLALEYNSYCKNKAIPVDPDGIHKLIETDPNHEFILLMKEKGLDLIKKGDNEE